MRKKFESALGIFGTVLFYVLVLVVSGFPFLLIDCTLILKVLLIAIGASFPPLAIGTWIWGLVVAIKGPQDALAIAYYILFVVLMLPTVIGFIASLLNDRGGRYSKPQKNNGNDSGGGLNIKGSTRVNNREIAAMELSDSVGGNFNYIAQNIATIYYAIGKTDFGKGLDNEKRLYATGLIDAVNYLAEGSLNEMDIKSCIVQGKKGEVSLEKYTVKHRNAVEQAGDIEVLTGLTMQLEAYFFSVDVPEVNYSDIIDEVVKRKSQIKNMITMTLSQGEDCPLFPAIMFNVSTYISTPDFRDVVISYGVK